MGILAGNRPAGGGASGFIVTVNGDAGPNVVLDAVDVGALPISGGTLNGDLDMAGFSVIGATIDEVSTAISATTAALGLAHTYRATAASITITVSTADFTEGRVFQFAATLAGSGAVTIATEGAQTIDGGADISLTVNFDSVTLVVVGGNLESRQ